MKVVWNCWFWTIFDDHCFNIIICDGWGRLLSAENVICNAGSFQLLLAKTSLNDLMGRLRLIIHQSFYTYALDERQPSPPVSEGLVDHLVQMGCPISSPTSVVRGKTDQACWISMGDMGNVKNCELSSPWHIFVLHFIVSEPLSQWNENIGIDWLMQLHQNFVPICAEKNWRTFFVPDLYHLLDSSTPWGQSGEPPGLDNKGL